MPANATNWISVWRRNYLVWRKLAIASMFGNLADPMIYLFGLGLGLGLMVGHVDGVSYIAFLAAGTVASSVMMSASFEVDVFRLFAHARSAHVGSDHAHAAHAGRYRARLKSSGRRASRCSQASRSCWWRACSAMRVFRRCCYALPVIVLTGLAFSSTAMIVTALAPSYDFFMFYQTLALTPMLLLSGVFFPLTQLPALAQHVSLLLPLSHAVALIRPAMLDRAPDQLILHVAVLAAYAIVPFFICAVLFRRRMMR